MAQIARTGAERPPETAATAASNVAELCKRTADQGAAVAREAADRVEDAAHSGARTVQRMDGAIGEAKLAVAQQSAEGTATLGRVFVDLANEQIRHNLEALNALTGAVDWDRVFQIQGEYLHVSLERTVRLIQRCLEVSQATMTSAASAAQRQAKKAA
jgi:hypothetical protein